MSNLILLIFYKVYVCNIPVSLYKHRISDSEKAEQFYQLIFEKISETKASRVPVTPAHSGADEIRKYNDLYKQGIITEDEFTAAKKKILGL